MLHRDMFILLAALSRMEKNLIRSARTKIKSGETALSCNFLSKKSYTQEKPATIDAEKKINDCIVILKMLELRILSKKHNRKLPHD